MSSSVSHFPGHFLLLDIGNPITQNGVGTIKKSLLNILSLASSLKGTSRIPVFGCGILEPNIRILQEWNFLNGNYTEIQEKLGNIETSFKIGTKCTVRDYKHYLVESISKIVAEFELKRNVWLLKTSVKDQLNPKRYWPAKIIITLVTKKAALPIQKMLEHISLCSNKLEKIEIVEISSYGDDKPGVTSENLNFVSYSMASENICDLETALKKWILDLDKSECEQIQIVLDERSGHHIQCDVVAFINPEKMTVSQSFLQSGFFQTAVTCDYFASQGVKLSACNMNVISKLKISDVSPSQLFGIPKIMYAAKSRNMSFIELQFNIQLFRALCSQLFKEQIGLLTKFGPDFNEITTFYFIISDGEKLLARSVIPMELQLPFCPEYLKISSPYNEDADFVVHSLLDRIEIAQEISPDNCSFGIYEYLKKQLKSEEVALGMTFEQFKNEKCRKIKEITSNVKTSIPPGECNQKSLKDVHFSNDNVCHGKNGKKLRKDSGNYSKGRKFPDEVIHPALLSPETAAKYRKFNVNKFLLPELSEPGVIEK